MKNYFTVRKALRLACIFSLLLSVLADLLLATPERRPFRICSCLHAASALLLQYPLTREENKMSVVCTSAMFAYFAAIWYPALVLDSFLYLYLLPAILAPHVYCAVKIMVKYREVPELFRRDAVWCCAEEDSRAFYVSLHTVSGMALSVMYLENTPDIVPSGFAAAETLYFFLLYRKAYSGRTILLGKGRERRIQYIITTDSQNSAVVPELDGNIVAKVYKKVQYYMKTRKPFLSDKFSLKELSSLLNINKLYISRAVNKYSGLNFRSYVNQHRVAYSVELMNEDPWLKVIELAFMSGFHSMVTYNMAFRMFMDETPSDMLSRLRMSRPRRELSRKPAQEAGAGSAPSSQDE